MNEEELAIAAFQKMLHGEPMTIPDAQRVFGAFIQKPPIIDTANQEQLQAVLSQIRAGIQETYFTQK